MTKYPIKNRIGVKDSNIDFPLVSEKYGQAVTLARLLAEPPVLLD
jgi:hypothetical protein